MFKYSAANERAMIDAGKTISDIYHKCNTRERAVLHKFAQATIREMHLRSVKRPRSKHDLEARTFGVAAFLFQDAVSRLEMPNTIHATADARLILSAQDGAK